MITAVDSNVILDVLAGDRTHGPASTDALRRCLAEGQLVACAPVWAEVAAAYDHADDAASVMDEIGISFDAIDRKVAVAAGGAWRAHRRAGGTRRRIISDFLIGAHAADRADRLLTRDRGFYRSHFGRLRIMDPAASLA